MITKRDLATLRALCARVEALQRRLAVRGSDDRDSCERIVCESVGVAKDRLLSALRQAERAS